MKKSLRNVLVLFAGDAGVRVAGFLISIYLARVLEPSAFGVMSIGLGVLAYLMLLASPGIQMLEARNVAADRGLDRSRVGAVLSLRFILAIILFAVVFAATWLLPLPTDVRESVALFSLSLIPLSLFLDWFFQGRERFATVSVARLTSYAVYGAIVLLLVRSAGDVQWVPLGFAAGNLVATLVLLATYRRDVGAPALVWQPRRWTGILSSNLPVGLSMFLAQSAVNLPPIVLGWFALTRDAGLFSAAMKIIFVLLILDRVLNAVLLPAVARVFVSRRDDVPFLLAVVLKSVLLVAIPLMVCGIVLSPVIIAIVFGDQYLGAVPALRILFGYVVLTLLNSVFVCTLIGARREKEYSRAINAGAFVFLVAIVVGTLLLGMEGAAYGVCTGEFVTVILMALRARKAARLPLAAASRGALLAGMAMVATVALLNGSHAAVQVLGGLLVFALAVAGLGTLHSQEIRFLREKFV